MVDIKELKDASPWHPIQEPVDLKHLGKFAEELGECMAAISRCIIQGVNEKEPVTGKVNKEWLEDEIADMFAGGQLCIEHFSLDRQKIAERIAQKKIHLRQWHAMA